MPRVTPPRKDTLRCAALCLVCALLSLGLFMVQDGGAFTLREDFDFQQLPFIMGLHKQIARGGLAGWCWNLDLGVSAIQGFGFYELGSPFFWVSMLFTADAFPYVAGWLYILKYTVAGITSYLFLRRFVRDTRCATAGALLYAFSGFQVANLLFFHFHDVVALFPLLLIALERLMENGRDWPRFVLAVFVNALTNYFFFVQSTIFLLLYFGFRFGPSLMREGRARLLGAIGRCFACGVLGVAMAGALIVPSFVYLLGNPRVGAPVLSLGNLVWDPWQFLFQIQGFLLPADPMFDHNAIIDQQWTSTCCWLPVVGPSLAVAYLHRKRGTRDWLARLLLALLLACLSPILTSGFLLFTGIYQRWWYTLVLMGALASVRVLDDAASYDVRKACLQTAAATAGFVAVVLVASLAFGVVQVFHLDRFLLFSAIALGGIALTRLIVCQAQTQGELPAAEAVRARSRRVLLAAIAVTAVGTTALTLFLYRQNLYTGELLENIAPAEQQAGTLTQLALGSRLRTLDPQYRYATGDNRLSLPGEAAGISSFCSTICSATSRFEELFDSPAYKVWHLNKSTVPGLTELLGGRFRITGDPQDATIADTHEVAGTTFYVVEQQACPIGVLYERYADLAAVKALPLGLRAKALMQAPVVEAEDAGALDGFAARIDVSALDFSRIATELVPDVQEHAVSDFWRNDFGFGFTTAAEGPTIAYLSVPHDDGWTALVDGAECPIVDSAGMMLLPLGAGNHAVEFRYETPGLRVGLAVAAMAWLAFGVLAARGRGVLARKE